MTATSWDMSDWQIDSQSRCYCPLQTESDCYRRRVTSVERSLCVCLCFSSWILWQESPSRRESTGRRKGTALFPMFHLGEFFCCFVRDGKINNQWTMDRSQKRLKAYHIPIHHDCCGNCWFHRILAWAKYRSCHSWNRSRTDCCTAYSVWLYRSKVCFEHKELSTKENDKESQTYNWIWWK